MRCNASRHSEHPVKCVRAASRFGGRTTIEFFVGGHRINGQGTYEFLHRHLN